jgi:hypothetical protein
MQLQRIIAAGGLLALLAVGYATAAEVDLTGTWDLTVQTAAGPGNPTLVLEQDGDDITGTYQGQLGESSVAGTVNGRNFALAFEVSSPLGSLDVRYEGEVADDHTISGTVNMGQLGQGTFSGRRK